jgi:murein DD-endopeptidase MepM/ murein hydrolase activator NlpD
MRSRAVVFSFSKSAEAPLTKTDSVRERAMMKRRYLTVLVVRHAGARFRQLRVSYPFVAIVLLAAAVLAAAGLYAPRLLLQVQDRELVVNRLQHENSQLRQERDTFEGALAQVTNQLGEVEAQASRLAQELGIGELASTNVAAGGPSALYGRQRFWFESDFRGLRSRTATLDGALDELDDAFSERMSRLAATPSTMPIEGWFSHGFGWRKDPFTGQREFHRGIDIVAPDGTEIRAPADGVISRSGRFPALGRSLDIAHGYGYVTRYAHMKDIARRTGDRVRRGDVIGRVGSTGRSTGPHLHYEVFRDGRRVNPWKYLGQNGR